MDVSLSKLKEKHSLVSSVESLSVSVSYPVLSIATTSKDNHVTGDSKQLINKWVLLHPAFYLVENRSILHQMQR